MQASEEQYKLKIGDAAPDFRELPGVDGNRYSLSSFQDQKALVVVWHCNHCPYANAFEGRINQVAKEYRDKGVAVVAINSNNAEEYPDDGFPAMKERAQQRGLAFPYLYDESQEVAEAYGALCTPHVFVFDGGRRLVYQGRIDGEKDDAAKGKAQDLRAALDDLLSGRGVATPVTRAFGCSVKWKPEHFQRASS